MQGVQIVSAHITQLFLAHWHSRRHQQDRRRRLVALWSEPDTSRASTVHRRHGLVELNKIETFGNKLGTARKFPRHGFGSTKELHRIEADPGTFNRLVAGWNPARPTTNKYQAHEFTFVGFLLSGRSLVAPEKVRSLPVRIDIENSSHKAGLNLACRTKKDALRRAYRLC